MNKIFVLFMVLGSFMLMAGSCSKVPGVSIAFYNVENLFDTHDDPQKNDNWYLPTSEIKWTSEKYNSKLEKLAEVISQINDGSAPDFIGLCEVENKSVVEDLIKESKLLSANYKIVHYESPDERGIDVAFLYNKEIFRVTDSRNIEVDLGSFDDKTRDILYVEGKLGSGEKLHFLVNHWSSRGEGLRKSEPKRIIAAKTLLKAKNEIIAKDPNANIIIMGDFNDEPFNSSIEVALGAKFDQSDVKQGDLYNPWADLKKKGKGSYRYKKNWNMLDQIIISRHLLDPESSVRYIDNSATIFKKDWLIQTGDYAGFPLRTYGGRKYLNGYSDHLSVCLRLEIDLKE